MADGQRAGRIDWAFVAVCNVYLFLTLLTWNAIEEDAFIYVRVADNIADGFGYVFNRGGERVETGTWFMNRCDYLDPALAWTGVKRSGRGCALSALGFDQLTQPKSFHLKKEI